MTRKARADMREAKRKALRARDVRVVLALELGLTVREVAEAFGLSPGRVSQIRAAARTVR